MGSLSDLYIKKETLKTLFDTIEKKGEKGVNITISIGDDTNEYGHNLTSFVSQSKEQREAKKAKFYVGNGKVFWTDGKIVLAKKKDEPATSQQQTDSADDEETDLPF